MHLLQLLIFCGVVGSSVHWQWTPNQYLASGIGAGLAWIATHIVVACEIVEATSQKKRPPAEEKEAAAASR
jgi:hypothetical protein